MSEDFQLKTFADHGDEQDRTIANLQQQLASLKAEHAKERQPVKVHIGTSCLTKDLVWCECGRGLSLSGKWLYCPTCGHPIDQESYVSAVAEAKHNGASLYYRDSEMVDEIEKLTGERDAAILNADISEQCARGYDRKQPFCEHENRYTFTDDGGKTGHCVMCRNVAQGEDITRLKEHRTRLRKAVSGVLGGLGPTSAVWGNSPYDRAYCNGVTAALTAFDDESKRIDAEPPAKPIAGESET